MRSGKQRFDQLPLLIGEVRRTERVVVTYRQSYPAAERLHDQLPNTLSGLEWGLPSALLCAGLPIAAFHAGGGSMAKGGRGRVAPLLLAAAALVMGLSVLIMPGAPVQVVEVMVALLVMLAVLAPLTARWDVSWHTATLAVCVTWAVMRLGPAAAAGVVVVAASAWGRVRLGEHTPPQTAVGAVIGTSTAAIVLTIAS
ncbi:hypothetical protein [Streptosporangium brasiliense]|uniref:Phosphatidic acid phosphatase type 2/haloperoxidase domain-containing protein n=1 Tax=Streptosporangium brasiliense TaxID=47480 RepID=A0ABT9QYS9_9ACTN|nr:hypothetical protein [Streptosporangium brasiliense]MDP9862112.1 hypothetical protein [Streptosporangium brasiliense]